jgi:serine/threonine-protein kinase
MRLVDESPESGDVADVLLQGIGVHGVLRTARRGDDSYCRAALGEAEYRAEEGAAMRKPFRCLRGHHWEVTIAAEGVPVLPCLACPVCGGTAETLAPGDSAPDRMVEWMQAAPSTEQSAIERWAALIGYELLGELGRGGMGVVYKARQRGLGRLVALKVMQASGLVGREVPLRFHDEARAAARLQHPNIVTIHEVGELEGRPYFSLELAEGGSLDRKLAGQPQPAGAAAELVETLARAIHFAHQHGIVHRDLKPANVLLTGSRGRFDGTDGTAGTDGIHPSHPSHLSHQVVPKITDFGLARNLDDAGRTASGAILGTPSYMAPEQAEGRARESGPPCDVYALGAILYEMLTGRPPFRGTTTLETLEQVRSQEPVPPRRLQPGVPRDLETICLKCLRKEPDKRYASAEELAGDLQRVRRGEPIQARPVGLPERLWRWCRRNPTVAGLSAAVVAALLAGTVTAWFFALHSAEQARAARLAQGQAEEGQRKAQQSRKLTLDVLNEMTQTVVKELLGQQVQLTDEHRRYLRHVLDHYQRFVQETGEDEAYLVRAYFLVGDIRERLGEHADAEAAYRQGLALQQRVAAEHLEEPEDRALLALSHTRLGALLTGLGRRADAEAAYRQALPILQRLVEEYPRRPVYQQALAVCQNKRGALLRDLGQRLEAEAAFRQAVKVLERLAREDPTHAGYRVVLAQSHNHLGSLLRSWNRSDEAEQAIREALKIGKRLLAEQPDEPVYQGDLAAIHNNLGNLLSDRGRAAAAEEECRQALKLRKSLADRYPAIPDFRLHLAASHNNLGHLLRKDAARYADAEGAFREAVRIQEELTGRYPRVQKYQRILAVSHNNLADLLTKRGRSSEAEQFFRRALTSQQQMIEVNSADTTVEYGVTCKNLADLLVNRGEPAAALGWYGKAVVALKPIIDGDGQLVTARLALRGAHAGRAGVLTRLARHAEALPDWDAAIGFAEGGERTRFRLHRALTLARLNKPAAAAEADELAGAPDSGAGTLFFAARVHAVLATTCRDSKQAEATAERAIALLRQAVARGFKDIKRLKKDADLAELRRRDDFQKLLREVEAKR